MIIHAASKPCRVMDRYCKYVFIWARYYYGCMLDLEQFVPLYNRPCQKRCWGTWGGGQDIHILHVNILDFVLFLVVIIEQSADSTCVLRS